MVRIIGRLTKIGIKRETTRGTPVAPAYWVPVLELGYDDKFEFADNESGYGNIAIASDSQIVKQWAEGDYAGKIFDQSVGAELCALFGQLPTSVQRTTTGVYDNSYTMAQNNQHASMTVAVAEPNYSGRYPMAMINSWTIQAELGDFIRRTVNLVSKTSASSSESVAYTNENEFIPKNIIFKTAAVNAADATLDAATALKVRSINLAIAKNAEALQVLGSNDIDDVANKGLAVTGTIEAYYDDRTYHNLAKNGTHQSGRIEMINTDVIIGTSGTHNPALRFQMPEMVFSFPERGLANNDIQTISIPFKAVLNLASSTMITARLTNAVNGAVTY